MNLPALVILDVAHGNCSVLFDTNGIVVIDAGPGCSLLDFLVEHNISRIDAIIISHADKDHIEGVIALLSSKVVEIGLIKLNSDGLKDTELWDDLLFELNEEHVKGKISFEITLTPSDTGKLDFGKIHTEILAPSLYLAGKGPGSTDTNGVKITTNSISAVVRLMYGTLPVALLTGDIDELALNHLTQTGADLRANILVFPHHGGKSGIDELEVFSERLTMLVAPQLVVFSIGRFNFMNPQPEVVAGVRKASPTSRILCTQLSRHCATALPVANSTHIHNIYARGRGKKACCSGSILIEINDSGMTVLPEIALHQHFITTNAPTALCKNW